MDTPIEEMQVTAPAPVDSAPRRLTTVSLSLRNLCMVIFAISLVVSGTSIAVYDLFVAQKVVTVNPQKYLDEQRRL